MGRQVGEHLVREVGNKRPKSASHFTYIIAVTKGEETRKSARKSQVRVRAYKQNDKKIDKTRRRLWKKNAPRVFFAQFHFPTWETLCENVGSILYEWKAATGDLHTAVCFCIRWMDNAIIYGVFVWAPFVPRRRIDVYWFLKQQSWNIDVECDCESESLIDRRREFNLRVRKFQFRIREKIAVQSDDQISIERPNCFVWRSNFRVHKENDRCVQNENFKLNFARKYQKA